MSDNFDELDPIASRLDDIESKIDSLDRGSRFDGGWIVWTIICGFIGWHIGSGEYKFTLPKEGINTVKTKKLSNQQIRYNIVYDEEYSGYAEWDEEGRAVSFLIKNQSKNPFWLDDIKVHVWLENDTGFGLKVIEHASDNYGNKIVVNPGRAGAFGAVVQDVMPDSKIQGFSINSKDQRKIRFGYEKLGWWDKLRWWIAEAIRE